MPTVRELIESIGVRAPFTKAAEWDPVGLQVGDPEASVLRIAVCHEVTEHVVERIERDPVDLLVAYHPLLFRPTRHILAGQTPAGRALRLARLGTALVVAHTNFDVAPGGAADALSEALGLRAQRAFGTIRGALVRKVVTFVPEAAVDPLLEAVVAAGGARIGSYTHCSFRMEGTGTFFAGSGTNPVVGRKGELQHEPEIRVEFVAPEDREEAVLAALRAAHPYEEPAFDIYDRHGDAGMAGRVGDLSSPMTLSALAELVARTLRAPAPRIAGPRDRPVGRVAVVPGSGSDFIGLAAAMGADALVTGDVKHHDARTALDRGLCVVDPGHAPTERPGVGRLYDWVRSLGLETIDLLDLDPDPWRVA